MSRPSDPLLRWLRKLIQERNVSAAILSEKAGIQRNRVRHILSGAEPMTVDELLAVTRALDISAQDFGLSMPEEAALAEDEPEETPPGVVAFPGARAADDDHIPYGIDPLGNQARQLFEIAFTLGCDFLFLTRTADLGHSGVPNAVLERYAGRDLPIKMDAAYHQYNNPKYTDEAVTFTLSFDALHECTFPWGSVRQIVFYPAEPPPPQEEPKEEPPKGKVRPFLRLVE